jgi:hypothetical protein
MRARNLLVGFALFACACASVDPFEVNREAAIARARADSGCAEPMTADVVESMEAGVGRNRVAKAEVVVAGCDEVHRYQTICAKGSYVSGCDSNAIETSTRQ